MRYVVTLIEKIHAARHRIVLGFLVVSLALSACASMPFQLESLARIAATPYQAVILPTSTVAAATISTAALVKERSKLRVGIRFDAPPLSSVSDDGQLQGLDVDLAREFARRWLGSPDNVEFVQVTSSSAPHRIERREVDLAMGGLVHTKAAETYADFGLTYMFDGEAVLVRTGSFADFPSLAQRLVTYIDTASTYALRDAMISNNITVSVQSAQSYASAVGLLLDNQTDAVIGRWRRLRAVVGQDPALTVLMVVQREPVAFMLPQNDSDWADLVNITFSAMVADGTYASMYEHWFESPPDTIAVLPQNVDLQLAMLPETTAARNGLDRLRSTTSVRIGFNAQTDPMATLDETGQPIGFEIDLCRELARRWFQNGAAAQFSALPPNELAQSLSTNAIDLAVGALVETQAQVRLMDFSLPTLHGGSGIAVLASSAYIDIPSLNGRVIGVISGTSDKALLESVKQLRNINLGAIEFPNLDAALNALRSGQVDALLNDQLTLLALSRTATDLRMLTDRINIVPIAFGLPRNDSPLKDFVNLTLQDIYADGTYARIYKNWFGQTAEAMEYWPGEATINTALIAPTATTLPTLTPVFTIIDTPVPLPQPPTAPPDATPAP